MNKSYKPHWKNPWNDVVYVPIEELAECDYMLGKSCGMPDGTSVLVTKEFILEHWRSCGDKLDAYILPQPSGFHSIGIRYGAEGSEYISPMGDEDKVQELLNKYM